MTDWGPRALRWRLHLRLIRVTWPISRHWYQRVCPRCERRASRRWFKPESSDRDARMVCQQCSGWLWRGHHSEGMTDPATWSDS